MTMTVPGAVPGPLLVVVASKNIRLPCGACDTEAPPGVRLARSVVARSAGFTTGMV